MTEQNQKQRGNTLYISTALAEAEIDLDDTHRELAKIEKAIASAKDTHNAFLKEPGLKLLP